MKGEFNLEFGMLGPLEIWWQGQRISTRGARQGSVLATLLLEPGRVVPLDRLVSAVWGHELPKSARPALHSHISRLRKLLAADPEIELVGHPHGYELRVHPEKVDLHRFRRLVAEANATDEPEATARLLAEALDLWRGPALADVDSDWLTAQVGSCLEEERLSAVEACLAARLDLMRHAELIGELTGLVASYPLRERLSELLITALYRCGRQADALRAYQRARTRLVDELGVEPSPALRELHERVLRADPTLATSPTPVTGRHASTPNTLPRDIVDFTGRHDEITHLLADDAGDRVVIDAIDGMAGVGKTTLAIHAAHLLTSRYPDAQLYVNLHAHVVGGSPLSPGPALDILLRVIGTRPDQIPEAIEERAALWRAKLAQRRALLVLDDASDSAQVRPLLPGAGRCRVLITSRRVLVGLDGARPLSLGTPSVSDTALLFSRIVGADRAPADADTVRTIVRQCGYLPLAVRIAAARLRHRHTWTTEHLSARLDDEQRRLAELAAEDQSVTAAFALSYRALNDDQQRMFRLLGLHPGSTMDGQAAAALAGLSPEFAERLLEELVDTSLLSECAPGRYFSHELVRAYARRCAEHQDTDEDRHAALGRLLDWYLHAAHAADLQLLLPRRPLEIGSPQPHVALKAFGDYSGALKWFETELDNLLAAIRYAAAHGWHTHTWQLPWTLWSFFYVRKHWDDWIDTHRLALAATRRLGDRDAESRTLIDIGLAYDDLRRYDEAIACHERALALYRTLGDLAGQAVGLTALGLAYQDLGLFDRAIGYHRQALALYRETNNERAQGYTLNSIGGCYVGLGRYDRAIEHCQLALGMSRRRRDHFCEADTLNNLGNANAGLSRFDRAVDCLSQALTLFRQLRNPHGEAYALDYLGMCYVETGDGERATQYWRQALVIFDELGDPRADDVRLRLDPSAS